jgi:hypothetical protein
MLNNYTPTLEKIYGYTYLLLYSERRIPEQSENDATEVNIYILLVSLFFHFFMLHIIITTTYGQ